MKLKLSHASNPDVRGGYWSEPIDPKRAQYIEVPTMEAASKAVRAYIEKNGLGGGNWTGGSLTVNGNEIARISYNGRAWDNAGQEIALVVQS